jgi:hypothetical protein
MITYLRTGAPEWVLYRRVQGQILTPRGSEEASRHLDFVCRHQLGNKSRAHLCKPLRLGYIYPHPMLVRVRESAIADYAPQACLCTCFEKKQVHKQALTRKRVRALMRAAGKW